MPLSLSQAVEQASLVLNMGITDALHELCRRGLVVGCPVRPAGKRTPLGAVIEEQAMVTTIYETPELGAGIAAYQEKYRISSYSAVIRMLLFAGLYAYDAAMEKENP